MLKGARDIGRRFPPIAREMTGDFSRKIGRRFRKSQANFENRRPIFRAESPAFFAGTLYEFGMGETVGENEP